MNITIQKYGGSSLATDEHVCAVADRVARSHRHGLSMIVVVSARGDTTDTLIRSAGTISSRPCPKETDKLLATGELASAALLAIALRERGVPSVSLSGPEAGLRADGRPGAGTVTAVDTGAVRDLLHRAHVVVVAGFQARGADGGVITLGRGGSDTSAVALAIAHGADVCEIYTDVEGIHSADPRLVAEAGVLPAVEAAVMIEMAASGARVMHSRAVELAAAHGMDIVVRHAHGQGKGSIITGRSSVVPRVLTHDGKATITAITHAAGAAQVVLHADRASGLPPLSEVDVFTALAGHRIAIDSVGRWSPTDDGVLMSFCVPVRELDQVRTALSSIVGLGSGTLRVHQPLGQVSVVGVGLLGDPSVAAAAISELTRHGIVSAGVSCTPMRVSLLVPEDRVKEAVVILHRRFGLDGNDEHTKELAVA
ncbi:aspartate kinase [Streptomyces spectabilis]|uniref:aspartate kinase n=1 Tax=Streptomyces spectabilis TaxID=68270 RepID=UPI0033F04881